MRRILSAVLAALAMSSAANATTWDATCSDGKLVKYIIQDDGNGARGMLILDVFGLTNVAEEAIAFTRGGRYAGGGTWCAKSASQSGPLEKICINRKLGTIYLTGSPFDQTPDDAAGALPERAYCRATVREQ